MKLDQEKIREILLKENYIEKSGAEKADEFVKTGEGDFLDYFIRSGLLTPDLLGQALAEYFKVSYLDLNTNIPDKALVLKIPEQMAKKFRAVLAKETEKIITVATDDPSAEGLQEEIGKIFPGKKISINCSLKKKKKKKNKI